MQPRIYLAFVIFSKLHNSITIDILFTFHLLDEC